MVPPLAVSRRGHSPHQWLTTFLPRSSPGELPFFFFFNSSRPFFVYFSEKGGENMIPKKTWSNPTLVEFGDVEKLTLAMNKNFGTGDSYRNSISWPASAFR